VSLCLFNPLNYVFMCIISKMILLYHEDSLSNMWTLFQSNSWSCKQCVEITEGIPLFLLISFLCSLILVVIRLSFDRHKKPHNPYNHFYTRHRLDLSILSLPVFMNILRVLGMVKVIGSKFTTTGLSPGSPNPVRARPQ